MGRSLFVSDLHLCVTRPALSRAFFDFIEREAGAASALYLLGDLFDAWLGDDDDSPLAHETAAALAALARSGTGVFIMPGNRDLLLGERFAARAGATLLADPCSLEIGGVRVVLTHGDLLCTGDRDYQRFRRLMHHRLVRSMLLALPLRARRAVARELRRRSRLATAAKTGQVMDAVPASADAMLHAAAARLLIHGHTHRPARHDTAAGTRLVLGDWGPMAWFVEWLPAGGPELRSLALDLDAEPGP